MNRLPLQSVRVADLSQIWAGPHATKLLGEMGAQIIKVESARRMDSTRGPLRPGKGGGVYPDGDPGERPWNRAAGFNTNNLNKYSLSLDLTSRSGKDVFRRLISVSDVVIENFRAGVMAKLGLDYQDLCKVKPDIIVVSMPALGRTGPEGHYVAYGVTQEELGGIVDRTGYIGGQPIKSGVNYGDPITGIHAAGAIISALFQRRRTGKGCLIDFSQLESSVCLVGESILEFSMNKNLPPRMGNRHVSMAPHGCYRCQGDDAWVTLSVASDEEWASLSRAMGDPAWASQERFAGAIGRYQNQDELDRLIEEWTSQRSHYEVQRCLQEAGVSVGAVLKGSEVPFDPQVKARQYFEPLTHPEAGTHSYPRVPWLMSKTPSHIQRPAPCLGEHNDFVLREVLGLTEEEMERLSGEGVTSVVPMGSGEE